MKKNIKLIFIGVLVIVTSLGIIINNPKKEGHTLKDDGVMYAISLDGETVNNFPTKGLYRVDISCKNARYSWLYDEWKLSLENITGDVFCDIDFVSVNKMYLNNYVISLVDTIQGMGEVVSENGYRYEGRDPNNYVLFNNELWRIIGVFDNSSHGQSNENLVKIIRNVSIGGLAWDKSNTNNWSTSSLKSLLNGAYYNAQNGSDGDYCYGYSTYVKANCDYRKIGIQTEYREMIQNVTWFLGGYSSPSAKAESFYQYERGTTVYSGNATSTTGYIGLMYPSDYGYSVLESNNCSRTTNLSIYNKSVCAGQSWIYRQGYEWTISPYSLFSSSGFYLDRTGAITNGNTLYGYAVRPTLYLKDSVYVIDGDGSLLDPYIISI